MLWFHEIPNVPFVIRLSGFVVNTAVKEYFYTIYSVALYEIGYTVFKLLHFKLYWNVHLTISDIEAN